jgi:hypothetical protein
MRDRYNRWWLLPVGTLSISAIVVVSILVFGPTFANRLVDRIAQRTATETNPTNSTAATTDCSGAAATDDACYEDRPQEAAPESLQTREAATAQCSGASASGYLCYQQRFGDLVRAYGVADAFAELKNELPTNEFARSNCHLLTHFIGRGAVDLYKDDIATVYSHGDNFCGSGYYHGAMEAIVENLGSDRILKKANTLCANLDGYRGHSFNHYNCAHGLGHGFMDIKDDDLFDSLKTCDMLEDGWERNRCYGGVFMENVVANNNPGHSSKYLKADQPLYPCDVVGNSYKNECYQRQTSYALQTQGNDFGKVFDLCAKAEDNFRAACYQGLGWDASVQSLKQGTSDASINGSTGTLCLLGHDYEARFNCTVGAVDYFIRDSYNNTRAKAFCEYFDAGVRTLCLQESEEYYRSLQSPLERRGTQIVEGGG